MSPAELQRAMVRNTLSNYLRTLVAMVVGLVTFRLLYQHFNAEEFGFWSLLWSVFGYGVLLDFGFGFAAQKRVAELSVKQDWDQLSRVLSSILLFYIGIALLVAALVLLSAPWLITWFGVPAARADEFRLVMIVFFTGIGLSFPLGIFPEILRGQQRIALTNGLITAAILARLGLVLLAIHLDWSFLTLMLIALGSALAPDALAALFALRRLPAVQLRLRHFDLRSMGDTAKFSLFAYLGTATNLILAKTDQLIITTTLGVSAIVLYQAGAKVGEMFRDFTRQIQDVLSPAAAHLHAAGSRAALRTLLVEGTRWSVLIATPLYLLCAFYLPDLLQLLTGDTQLPQETWITGQILLLWYYSSILTHSVSKRIFMMTGHERRLMRLGIAEALANLLLSIALVLAFGSVAAVAVGSLLPTLYFGWGRLWPWMAREADCPQLTLWRRAVAPAWTASLPTLLALIALQKVTLAPSSHPTLAVFIEGTLAGSIALVSTWKIGLRPAERSRLLARFRPRTTTSEPLPA